jgi:hypothetical protein
MLRDHAVTTSTRWAATSVSILHYPCDAFATDLPIRGRLPPSADERNQPSVGFDTTEASSRSASISAFSASYSRIIRCRSAPVSAAFSATPLGVRI